MITYRKLAAQGAGKLIVAYLREQQAEPDKDVRFERDREAHLESGERLNTYYTAREGRGAWGPQIGPRIAAALGIDTSRPPSDEAMANLFECKRADTGEAWAGQHAHRTISAFDFTASPDKSVTLAAEFAATKEEQALIWLAIHRANERVMALIEKELGIARRGKGGLASIEEGEVAWISFRHYSARPIMQIQDGLGGATGLAEVPIAGDPQAHIHNIILNAVATASGHLGSLDSARITKTTSHLFGAVFQAELATALRELGIRVQPDERGRAIVIDAIPKKARDHFSKRSKQALAQAKAFVKRQGGEWEKMSAEQKFQVLHQANLAFRAKKYDGKNDREMWREQAKEIGWTHKSVLTDGRQELRPEVERFEMAYEIAAKMLAEEFRTAAVIDRDAFRTHAAHGLIAAGMRDVSDVERVAALIEKRGITIDGEPVQFQVRQQNGTLRVTTSAQIEIEQRMAHLAGLSARTRAGALPEEAITAAIQRSGLDFSKEPEHGAAQLAAIRALGLAGGLAFLTGVAGAGKTTLLRPLVEAWKQDGRTVIGAAIAWRQAEALADAGIERRYAMAPLLDRIARGDLEIDARSVLVIDEISQVSPRQLLKLLELQQEKGFALRLLGDHGQSQTIEAGDAVELLERVLPEEARPALLSSIRQSTARGRQIAGLFRSPGRDIRLDEHAQREVDTQRARTAIDMKREDGTLRLVGGDHEQVVEQIADLYLQRRDLLQAAGSTRGITMSAPTNEDVMDLSTAIRARLRARGEIGRDECRFRRSRPSITG